MSSWYPTYTNLEDEAIWTLPAYFNKAKVLKFARLNELCAGLLDSLSYKENGLKNGVATIQKVSQECFHSA